MRLRIANPAPSAKVRHVPSRRASRSAPAHGEPHLVETIASGAVERPHPECVGIPGLPPGPLPISRFVPHALLDPELEARCDVAGRLLGVSQHGPQGPSSRSILRCRGIPILKPAIPR